MKRVSLLLYLGILLASLALAYLTWVQEPTKPGDKVPVFSCRKGGIVKLTYEAKDRTVTFSKEKNRYSGEPSWWVEIVHPPATPAVQAADSTEGVGGEETAPDEAVSQKETGPGASAVTEVFKGSERLQGSIDKFCPWTALRSLGKPGEGKRAEFGLTGSEESLIIEGASGPRRFRIGETTFGPRDRYVADDKTGEVFLVAGQDLRDLHSPKSRFMERALHGFEAKEISRIKLRGGLKEKELVRQGSEEGKESGWADSRSPEEAKVLYRNWIRRLFALRPVDYVGPKVRGEGEGCAVPAGATEKLHVTFFSPAREIGFLNLYEGDGADDKGDPTYYACSEHTEIPVKLPKTQAETLLKDLEDVLSD